MNPKKICEEARHVCINLYECMKNSSCAETIYFSGGRYCKRELLKTQYERDAELGIGTLVEGDMKRIKR